MGCNESEKGKIKAIFFGKSCPECMQYDSRFNKDCKTCEGKGYIGELFKSDINKINRIKPSITANLDDPESEEKLNKFFGAFFDNPNLIAYCGKCNGRGFIWINPRQEGDKYFGDTVPCDKCGSIGQIKL